MNVQFIKKNRKIKKKEGNDKSSFSVWEMI